MQLIKFIELCRKLAFLRSHALLWDKEKKSLYELRLLLSLGEKKSEEKISQYVANAGFGAYKKL